MFEIEPEMMKEETLIYKKGDNVRTLTHNLYDGSVEDDGKKIGFWNGKTITKGEESDSDSDSDSDSESDSDSDSESESESESDSERGSDNEEENKKGGGADMEELNRFKKLLNGGGLDNDGKEHINIVGGGDRMHRGYGFTFL